MCGIFASVGWVTDRERIDVVAHRGPDGSGWRLYESGAGPVALGHRRLAIIDLSNAGLQPMADPSERYHLIFNGELYNYVELREELKSLGEAFATDSDSEVLLRAYIRFGEDCLARFRGMFAFVIWDDRDKILFAARDRFGIKPLYLTQDRRGFALASEIKQLLGLPGVTGRMNVARVHDFLASGISDHTSETLFGGVSQLRGGECLTARIVEGAPSVTIRRWYAVGAPDLSLTAAQAAERFRDLLSESIRIHLRADVPIGSCLSGGLDSSSIVCLVANALGDAGAGVHTFSACYPQKEVDEKPFIDMVVAHAQTTAHYIWPRAEDVFAKADAITWHQDEPFGSTSIFAQWCVFEAAKHAGVTVMLDGQGADEQLAGYHGGFDYHLATLARRGDAAGLLRTVRARARIHGAPVSQQLLRMAAIMLPGPLASIVRRRRMSMTQHDWLSGEAIETRGNPLGATRLAASSLGLGEIKDVKSLCTTLTHASNLQMLLHWEDRNSMAHSIEARVPFLDHPLVEFSLGLGNHHKYEGAVTKSVLRRAMKDVLPERVRMRQDKLGFATPESAWFRGPLRGAIEDGIAKTLSLYPDLFNAEGVRALANDMFEGRRTLDFTLWRIVSLGLWGDKFRVSV